MKSLLKKILINTLAIASVATFIPGLSYQNNINILLIAALALTLINIILRPIIKALLLPINIITLGLTGWLVNVVILFIATYIVPDFSIQL